MTWLQFLIDHYKQRLSESKSYKEKQFLSSTLRGLQSETNENSHYPLYVLRYNPSNVFHQP